MKVGPYFDEKALKQLVDAQDRWQITDEEMAILLSVKLERFKKWKRGIWQPNFDYLKTWGRRLGMRVKFTFESMEPPIERGRGT